MRAEAGSPAKEAPRGDTETNHNRNCGSHSSDPGPVNINLSGDNWDTLFVICIDELTDCGTPTSLFVSLSLVSQVFAHCMRGAVNESTNSAHTRVRPSYTREWLEKVHYRQQQKRKKEEELFVSPPRRPKPKRVLAGPLALADDTGSTV